MQKNKYKVSERDMLSLNGSMVWCRNLPHKSPNYIQAKDIKHNKGNRTKEIEYEGKLRTVHINQIRKIPVQNTNNSCVDNVYWWYGHKQQPENK